MNFVEIGGWGICSVHDWLRGMDAPDHIITLGYVTVLFEKVN